MSKFLCGILPLELETGRYQGVPEEERYCRVCGSGEVETEIHFIFRCPKLTDSRKHVLDLLHSVKGLKTYMKKLKYLVSEEVIKQFAEALEILFNARQRILYRGD